MDSNIKIKKENLKILFILSFLIILFLLTFYFLVILKTSVVVSHFYYFPVILASVWWKKKGLVVAFFLTGLILLFPVFLNFDLLSLASLDNIIRSLFLILVGGVTSILSIKASNSQQELKGRVKELNCLYGITKLVSNPNNTIDEILWGVLSRIKCALDNPHQSFVKIHFRGKDYMSENFTPSPWKITKEIEIHDHALNIDIYFLGVKNIHEQEHELLEKVIQELKATFEYKLAFIK